MANIFHEIPPSTRSDAPSRQPSLIVFSLGPEMQVGSLCESRHSLVAGGLSTRHAFYGDKAPSLQHKPIDKNFSLR
jgi:hypothetical protein